MDAAFAVEVRVFQEALSAMSCFGTGFATSVACGVVLLSCFSYFLFHIFV